MLNQEKSFEKHDFDLVSPSKQEVLTFLVLKDVSYKCVYSKSGRFSENPSRKLYIVVKVIQARS